MDTSPATNNVMEIDDDMNIGKTPISRRQQDEYTDQLPSPPRVYIPGPQTNPCLPSTINGSAWTRSDSSDWHYSKRREAQEILPHLLLGPISVGRDEIYVTTKCITMIVYVRHARPGTPLPPNMNIAKKRNLSLELYNAPKVSTLASIFPQATYAMRQHFQNVRRTPGHLGKAFVCCESGNEWSAALVIAYLVDVERMDLTQAIQLVTNQRFCTNINNDLRLALVGFSDIVQARRDVENVGTHRGIKLRQSIMCNIPINNDTTAPRPSKRSFHDTAQDTADVPQSMHMDPPEERRSFTPFIDP